MEGVRVIWKNDYMETEKGNEYFNPPNSFGILCFY